MLVSTQDGIYIAVREKHNILKITTEHKQALQKLHVFLGGALTDFFAREYIHCSDQEWVEFLAAHVQDIQYTEYPPVPEQMFD